MGAFRADRRDKVRIAADLDAQFQLFPRLKERRRQRAIAERRRTADGGDRARPDGPPRLLLLDEPSLGLAPLVARQIMALIVDLRHQGCTILLVEQNARIALGIADRGYVLETGRIALTGPAPNCSTIKRCRKPISAAQAPAPWKPASAPARHSMGGAENRRTQRPRIQKQATRAGPWSPAFAGVTNEWFNLKR